LAGVPDIVRQTVKVIAAEEAEETAWLTPPERQHIPARWAALPYTVDAEGHTVIEILVFSARVGWSIVPWSR
jgi:hypothetical protein